MVVRKPVAGLSETSLQRFSARACAAAGLRGQINILVTTNRELQSLNRRFRHKNEATDVLSFPADSSLARELAGDIAISAEQARASAKLLRHSIADEIKILVLHGILHLAGYDHERDNGTMARKETRLRRALKLPIALIERHESSRTASRGKSEGSRRKQR